MNITIQSIPHDKQRYETVGDWQIDPETGDIVIFVSDMGNDDYNVLVALHELIELKLCQKRGITQEIVDKFDIAFEAARVEGNEDEPGDDPEAPYESPHCIATGVERILAGVLGVKWKSYSHAVNSL